MNRFAIGGPIALGIILMALYAIRQSPYRVSATQSQAQTIPTPGVATNSAYRRLLMSQIAHEEPVVLFLPPDCTYKALGSQLTGQAQPQTATLPAAPVGFDQSVGVAYPPCSVPLTPVSQAQPDASSVGISFHIVSVTRYMGSAGTLYVTLMQPSVTALSRGLNLGNDVVGARPDGTSIYALNGAGSSPSGTVHWLQNGIVVSVAGDVSISKLLSLAAGVQVK